MLVDTYFIWDLLLKVCLIYDKLSVKHALNSATGNSTNAYFSYRELIFFMGHVELLNWMSCFLASWVKHAIHYLLRKKKLSSRRRPSWGHIQGIRKILFSENYGAKRGYTVIGWKSPIISNISDGSQWVNCMQCREWQPSLPSPTGCVCWGSCWS